MLIQQSRENRIEKKDLLSCAAVATTVTSGARCRVITVTVGQQTFRSAFVLFTADLKDSTLIHGPLP